MKTKEPTRPSSTKQQFVSLLRDFAKQIQAMDDSQIERILSGDLGIEVRVLDKDTTKVSKGRVRCSDQEIDQLRQALQETNSREKAEALIEQYLYSKADMIRFARFLDVPASQKSTSEDLKNRLVEATVGYRLRSAAIRGSIAASADSTGEDSSTQ